jgi:hypothetical protein
VSNVPEYDHLFSSKVEDQVFIVKVLKQKFEKKEEIVEK